MPYDNRQYFSACLASYVVLLNDEQQVFLMRRANTPWMNGYYNIPAGKMERHETFLETAVRETEEECGVIVNPEDMKLFLTQNRYDPDQEQCPDWVDMFFVTTKWSGEPRITEEDKSDHIGWFPLDDLPKNITPNITDALNYLKDNTLSFGLFGPDYDYFRKKVA